jgi:hypothetical protein
MPTHSDWCNLQAMRGYTLKRKRRLDVSTIAPVVAAAGLIIPITEPAIEIKSNTTDQNVNCSAIASCNS